MTDQATTQAPLPSHGPCDACDPRGTRVVQVRSELCRGCDLAARLIEARAAGGVLATRDAEVIRGTERGTFAALRRIGQLCFPGFVMPGVDATMSAGKMVDQLERVQLGPRKRRSR